MARASKIQVSKKKANAEEIADKLADLVWQHLKTLPEEEQEKCLSAAEGRLASVSRAGSRRTASSTRCTGKSLVSPRGR
jgi:hypothetical protein